MPDANALLLVCPTCRSSKGLWAVASFEGWHSVEVTFDGKHSKLEAATHGDPYYEVTGSEAYDLDRYDMGCSLCDWTGQVQDLVQLGTDGEPLVHPPKNQLTIESETDAQTL